MAAFDCWANYYDLIHQGLPGEAEFYVGQAVRIGGPTLELGCGTGRIAIAMAMSGVDVTGLDDSKGMLDVCRARLKAVGELSGSVKLVQQDMSAFSLPGKFCFVAMAYRSFMHLHRPKQQRECLNLVRKHMEDDGVFILNTWVPKASVLAADRSHSGDNGFDFIGEYPLSEPVALLRHYHRASYDEFRQRIVEEHLLQEVDEDGDLLQSTTLPLIRVWTTPREMDNLVRLCGFAVEALFGDFDCNPLDDSSAEMIWVLKKAL